MRLTHLKSYRASVKAAHPFFDGDNFPAEPADSFTKKHYLKNALATRMRYLDDKLRGP